jgi:replicative DNA helicase
MANLIAPMINHAPDKKILIITCEEPLNAVLSRIACCITCTSVKDFMFEPHKLTAEQVAFVKKTKRDLSKYIVVISDGTTVMENVQSHLIDAKELEYSAIIIDYYQVIQTSNEMRKANYVEIFKHLGTWLKEWSADLKIPCVLFAQLNRAPEGEDTPFPRLVQYDHTISNHVHVALKIVKKDDQQGAPTTEIHCMLSRHSDKPGIIGRFDYKDGKLEFAPHRDVEEVALEGIKPKA